MKTAQKHTCLIAWMGLATSLFATAAVAQQRYSVEEIASPVDAMYVVEVGGINDDGKSAVFAHAPDDPRRTVAFTVDRTGWVLLEPLDGMARMVTTGISAGGLAFGYGLLDRLVNDRPIDDRSVDIQPGHALAAIWDTHGVPASLAALAGDRCSMAWDANARGQIVGESYAPEQPRPVLWDGGSILDLTPPGYQFGRATGIADSGEFIVGTVWNTPGGNTEGFAVVWDSFVTIGTLPSGSFSELCAANNVGEAVGLADGEGYVNALRYDNRGLVSIDPLLGETEARLADLNDHGVAVGSSGDRAVVAFADELIDLHDLLESDSKDAWTLTEAVGINNAGQIVGHGLNPEGRHVAFLLTPTDADIKSARCR